ncbi:inositol-3-phosphate synthase [Microbispora corallina]|uniref:Myo-inositol-1-phosphate synthase n=1 Tax=Microbispora corallina TaxID=83302 RepID=A0ABQ4FYW3_9ACTN|nr:inositol-3-phosphate synthase [Microbispora corallina]GIH39982.1 myo-inositol-1-phosphate synthase [Microbispora corallina]
MRTGVWLVGARGSVAVTTVVGAAALARGLRPPVGCVTDSPQFSSVPLPAYGDLVFGGHDVAGVPLRERAERLALDGVVPAGLPAAVADDLDAAEARVRPGVDGADRRSQAEQVAGLAADLAAFREREGLGAVVVVNVSSTEPPAEPHPATADLALLDEALAAGVDALPVSSRYAYAALSAGCAYVDFTPSRGARLVALDQLALRRGVPYGGSDGKTGETLLKTALAPMFATRALRVTSWSGTNLLGGGDGATLADPAAAASKIDSKERVLQALLGHPVSGGVHIHNVPEMGEWKTAWDHVTFQGFLGTPMRMQFTWEGCDSALAAPLVLDLARLTARALAAGRRGCLPELAFFFKDPAGTQVHGLDEQHRMLVAWAAGLASGHAPA